MDNRLKESIFFIEANSFEQFSLWRENKEIWEEINTGHWAVVGNFFTNDICVSFSFARIFDQLICFYYPTSQVVHWGFIKAWMQTNCPAYVGNNCDAMNFGHAIDYCKTVSGKGGQDA